MFEVIMVLGVSFLIILSVILVEAMKQWYIDNI